ncbi:unnamed protein product [Coffea canephora]|uniref:Uncharacterized protein n=1 Tax=Coffea canephora TaxID=49390 RepID=A0A068V4U0_COFCA|nr:unnamed protein product [Coffea canephora]
MSKNSNCLCRSYLTYVKELISNAFGNLIFLKRIIFTWNAK